MSTVTVVPTVEASNVPPRVKLDVTDTGSPNLFAATVTRLNPDGTTSVVRTTDGNPLVLTTSGADRIGTVYDYEMQYQAPVSYSTVESPGTVSAEVTVPEDRPWLIPPGVPSLARAVMIGSVSARTRKVQRGVYYPMGRRSPVVQTDGQRKAAEYTVTLFTRGETERLDIEALCEDTSVLLFNVPADKGWGIGAEYVSVGDVTEGRINRFIGDADRMIELPLTVVDRPVGGTQAARTLADLMVYATLADLNAAYPTLLALQTGP